MSQGHYLANMPIEFLLDGSSVTLDMVYAVPGLPLPQPLPDHDIAFVAVAESEENQPLLRELAAVLRFMAAAGGQSARADRPVDAR